jgi:hypothetical protein
LNRKSPFTGVDLTGFYRLPKVIIDNAQIGDVRRDNFLWRVWPRDAPAGYRVFDIMKPVPDEPPDVELVV